ncbi:MAG: hypothetical protein ABJC63_03915 [Gemmatimonadales bacterium]
MRISLATPSVPRSLDDGLATVARLQSEAVRQGEHDLLRSVNYALRYQESATSLIGPSGDCQAFFPYGEEGLLVQEIDVELATGLLAGRYAPERYRELTA